MTLWWTCCSVLYCLLSQGHANTSDLKLTDCPRRYQIRGSDEETEIEIEVKDGRKACQLIQGSRKVENYVPTSPVLDPHISLGSGPKEVLNITWTAKVSEYQWFPKSYLLRLVKTYGAQSSTSCILLRLRKRSKLKTKEAIGEPACKKHSRHSALIHIHHNNRQTIQTFFFDCIKLVPEDNTYLIVQIWRFPRERKQTNEVHGSTSTTRHKRSLAGSTTCRRIMGDIQCSTKERVHLSLDPYIPSICHCSERPNPYIERLQNGSLQVSVWNLPQYAHSVEVKIIDKDSGNKPVYSMTLTGTKQVNESRVMATDEIIGPGHYTALVKADCPGDKEHLLGIGRDCDLMERVQSDNVVEVLFSVSSEDNAAWLQLLLSVGLPVSAVVVTAAVTLIVFCWTKISQGKKKAEQERNNKSIPLSTIVREDKTEGICFPSPDQYKSKEALFCITTEPKSTQVKLVHSSKNTLTETVLISEMPRCSSRTELGLLRNSKRSSKKMLLYHPDNPFHEDAVKEFCNLLSHACGINIVTDNSVNWRDFAESAGDEITEIVVIISPGLQELCKAYEDKINDFREFKSLREKRKYEYIPCVAMKKMQTLIQESPHICQFSLHLVLFCYDSRLVKEFLSLYTFLKRVPNCFSYNFRVGENARSADNRPFYEYKETLKDLIRRLKGISEHDSLSCEVDRIVSDEGFGEDLLQKLIKITVCKNN